MTTSQPLIGVIEDEPKLAALMHDYLLQAGYQAHAIHDGAAAVAWIKEAQPTLLLLDIMLPGKDGLAILKEVRTFSTLPVIMVTARVEEIDRLLGLELGADDYICKPFSPREVVARVKAVLRRLNPDPAVAQRLQLDSDRFEASLDGHLLPLTRTEFQLLLRLSSHPGHVYSRDKLLDTLYDDHRVVSTRTVDSHVKNLRRKLTEAVSGCDPVKSIYGVGYKWEL